MNKIFRRFVAYTIDMMVITLVIQSLVGIPQINKQLNNYNKYYNKYIEEYKSYVGLKTDLIDYYEDKSLSSKEYDKLISNHDKYKDTIDKYYKDNKLTNKNYDKLNNEIDKKYNKEHQDLYYKMEKNSILYFVLYLVAVFIYFVGFNKYTNGQTLGKKLMKLRIVDAKDDSKDVSVLSYIIRTIILYQPTLYLVKLIGINIMSPKMYLDITTIIYNIQYYLYFAVIAFAIIRIDGRGLHDLVAGTRVLRYDKYGKEVEDKFNKMVLNVKEEMAKEKEDSVENASDNEESVTKETISKPNLTKNKHQKSQSKKEKTTKKKIIEEPKE